MKKLYFTLSRYRFPVLTWIVLGFVFFLPHSNGFVIANCAISGTNLTPVLSPESMQVCRNLSNPEGSKEETIHILLIGQDRREGEDRCRSDCMILCSFLPESGQLKLTSFLRDLYVQIPDYGKNRLNAAYAFGGMPLIRQTFQENFGIPVTGCVEVDFSGFSQMVDLVGGITLSLREDEAAHLNWEVPGSRLSAGIQHLNGAQALTYSRIRSLDEDGDFSRTNRQRTVLMALLDRCKNASLPEMIQLFRKASPMMSTDIRKSEFLTLIRSICPRLSRLEVSSQWVPQEGTYQHRIIDGMAVLDADLDKVRAALRKSLGTP